MVLISIYHMISAFNAFDDARALAVYMISSKEQLPDLQHSL